MRPIPRIPRRGRAKAAVSTSQSIDVPAPIGGLNTRDSLSLMPITDAIKMVNWVPQPTGLSARRGYVPITASYGNPVETTIPYVNGTTKILITAAGANIYTDDVDGTKTSIGSGFTNNKWFSAKIANNMVLVNGQDDPRNFDGASLSTPSITGDLATYGEEKMNGIAKHKSRLFMWDSANGDFFYGGVNAVSGAFAKFQLSRVSNTGGNILEIKTISRDAGDGGDDYAAFILDTGEILVYQGSNPADATAWALVGRYVAPPLIAKGCAHEFAGDVLMVTQSDLIKLSDVIKYGSEAGGFNITPSKLSGAIANDFLLYGGNYGWQLTTHPASGWIIINVPEVAGTTYHQFVVNTVTGSATRFEGWASYQYAYLDGKLYFGADDDLMHADVGTSDNGSDIDLLALAAYNNLGVPKRKKISNARLYIFSDGVSSIDLSMGYDYETPTVQGTQQVETSGATWDVAAWDEADWSGLTSKLINFVTSGVGMYVTSQIALSINGQEITWHSTTYNFDISTTY